MNKAVADEAVTTKKFPARPGIFKIDDKFVGGWRNADKVWFASGTTAGW